MPLFRETNKYNFTCLFPFSSRRLFHSDPRLLIDYYRPKSPTPNPEPNTLYVGNIKLEYCFHYPFFDKFLHKLKFCQNETAKIPVHEADFAIYRQNLKQTGIYLITNKVNKKCYVGKSTNLRERFLNYGDRYYLTSKKNSLLCKSLLKFGLEKLDFVYNGPPKHVPYWANSKTLSKTLSGLNAFSVTIIEYCHPSVLDSREQHYINLLKPQLNIRNSVHKPSK